MSETASSTSCSDESADGQRGACLLEIESTQVINRQGFKNKRQKQSARAKSLFFVLKIIDIAV
jgi:hypothetical protein